LRRAGADGAFAFPAHIGVWLKPEARVIHCSEQHGIGRARAATAAPRVRPPSFGIS
jgi:hypothetical protein